MSDLSVYFLLILMIVVLAVLVLYTIHLVQDMFAPAPFVPTKRTLLEHIEKELALTSESICYDLGCANARVIYHLARSSGARCYGYEASLMPYLLSKFGRPRNARVNLGNFFTKKYSDATHVFTYLFPAVMKNIERKLVPTFPKGTVIVSLDFPFPTRSPIRTTTFRVGDDTHTLYLYQV